MISSTILEEFNPGGYKLSPEDGSVHWQAPSNIALVKYWGKKEGQMPANPSLSFTLTNCITTTQLDFTRLNTGTKEGSFEFYFHGKPKESFRPKLQTFFERCKPYFPMLSQYHLEIRSENTFPHSSGIASSASAMAALACCLVAMEQQLAPKAKIDVVRKSSFIARLGSGSACRSIEGPVVLWGADEKFKGSSDFYGTVFNRPINPIFSSYMDVILIVEQGVKAVSSTVGHRLMDGHPYSQSRIGQARSNLDALAKILSSGDLMAFAELVELEALSLHAMMMTSSPSYILMKPNTLNIIDRVQNFRKETGTPICFTLDAGANVHLLFPEAEAPKILQFIKDELIGYCENQMYICDKVGSGASIVR